MYITCKIEIKCAGWDLDNTALAGGGSARYDFRTTTHHVQQMQYLGGLHSDLLDVWAYAARLNTARQQQLNFLQS